MSILIIVESPGKIKKIASFLEGKYIVKASMGTIKDLDPKKLSVDLNTFCPEYIITKPKIVSTLKKDMKNIKILYLASDKDREGEQIAQSLLDTLKPKEYYRLTFNSITKKSIMDAIKNKGKINKNLVNAQKSRRIIDRLYGYLLSPVLQRAIKNKLSAGRVQSVVVKLVAEKESKIRKILEENKNSFYTVNGIFDDLKTNLTIKNEIAKIETNKLVIKLLKKFLKASYKISKIRKNKIYRKPPAPFKTSTLQQEGINKLKIPADLVMSTAQKLYEAGFITYMRTDSVAISEECHPAIVEVVREKFGDGYYQKRDYENNSANSQEAHECCRPTNPLLDTLETLIDDKLQIKLYDLIWRRTIASQMKDAEFMTYNIEISISNVDNYYFRTVVEQCIFLGFLGIYKENIDEINMIYKVGDCLFMKKITAIEKDYPLPLRYSQSSLIKKMEKIGIGRPSTYSSVIKTILEREYVEIKNVSGISKKYYTYEIKSKNKKPVMEIIEKSDTKMYGSEKNKIIITELGEKVVDFLSTYFTELIDYEFTNNMEKELDEIAKGTIKWKKYVKDFYSKLNLLIINFHKKNEN